MREFILLFVFAAATAAAAAVPDAPGPVQVSTSFEAGSLESWRVEDETTVVAVPRRGFDQDSVNTATSWFYFRLTNTAHREVTIQLTGLEYGVYNGRKGNNLPYSRNTVNVFSYDRETWHRFSNTGFDEQSRTFTMKQVFTADTVWVAYIVPYGFSRLERMLEKVGGHPAVTVGTYGHSVQGRPLYLVDVAEPGGRGGTRPVVWIIARQHAFETGGSWAAEGLLEFLASDAAEARAIRGRIDFRVCPMVNPDGVVDGHTRFNAAGVDLNRHWHASDPLSSDVEMAPETVLLKREMHRWKRNHRLDLWINIHNNDMVWNEDGDYIRHAPTDHPLAGRLEELLREETVYTGSYVGPSSEQSTDAVVADEYGCLALLMEMKTGFLNGLDRWTNTDVFKLRGRGLARAAARLFGRGGGE